MSLSMRRASGYVRVSRVLGREGDSFISPEVQREQITTWAKLRGVELVGWYEDLDVSGGVRQRPGLDAFMAALDAGETDGIVVARLDRLSRLGVADALSLVEDIHGRGGSIAAIDLGIDPTTTFGEFALTLMLALSRMERRRLSESWETAKSRAQARGVKIGPTPLGYRRNEDGTLTVHDAEAKVVREVFEAAAAYGLHAAMVRLNAAGLTHEAGKRQGRARSINTHTVRRLLANRTYLGEIRYGALPMVRDDTLALITRETFETAQPPEVVRRAKAGVFPLSGIARCGSCGEQMVGARGGGGQRTYRCRATLTSWRGERCTAGANVTANNLEAYVREGLRDALAGVTFEAVQDTPDLGGAAERLEQAEAELDDFLADVAGAATLRRLNRYDAALNARADAVDAARADYRELADTAATELSATPDDLLADESPEALRELLSGLGFRVVVQKGRGPLEGRVRLLADDTPPPPARAS